MKRIIFIMAAAMSLVACNQNTPDDTKKGGDTQTNQPADPSTWSPVGKMYVCDSTWKDSPADDKYWGWVFHFITKDSVVKYETPNRDLSYSEFSMNTIDSIRYEISYPTISFYCIGISGTIDTDFPDTTKFVFSERTYALRQMDSPFK